MIASSRFIPSGFDAVTIWPFIFVRPEHRNDTALIEHERVHYREQAWLAPLWWLRYLLSKKFRLAAEVRAYRRQIEVGDITVEGASNMLLKYRLGIDKRQALAAPTDDRSA